MAGWKPGVGGFQRITHLGDAIPAFLSNLEGIAPASLPGRAFELPATLWKLSDTGHPLDFPPLQWPGRPKLNSPHPRVLNRVSLLQLLAPLDILRLRPRS